MGESELAVKMFGYFDVTFRGRSIFLETNSSVKSIALLRFLLAQKEKAFTAEAIAQNIWPENEYVDEKKVIRTYIHRLRRILEKENAFKRDFTEHIGISNVKSGYKAIVATGVDIDAEIFEEYKIKVMGDMTEDEALSAFAHVDKLYSGEFLEECRYDHWAVMLRNYYLRTYSAIACRVLSKLQENRSFGKMLEICEKSLKICELDESINIFFLQALIDTEQITSAIQHYSYLTSKMYTELAVTPSEKLREVYARIKTYKKQDESLQALPTDAIDKQNLFIMLNEIVKTYLESDKNKYSIACIQIAKVDEQGEITREDLSGDGAARERAEIRASLKYAMQYALRKNDMYAVNEDKLSAVAVLYDAKPVFYSNIENRITSAFYSRYDRFVYKMLINISQATVVN